MEQVFAPWRIEWIERDERNADVEGCVFCAFAEGGDDPRRNVVARSDRAYVLLNNYPYNPGHLMVIPHRHTGDYGDLPDEVLLEAARLKGRALDALEAALDPDGFNVGMNLGEGAGGSITDHLHTHVVPRWTGDTNFMPVLADTKVVVEGLAETYGRLRTAFADQADARVVGEDLAVELDLG